jgi:hypothetical protein
LSAAAKFEKAIFCIVLSLFPFDSAAVSAPAFTDGTVRLFFGLFAFLVLFFKIFCTFSSSYSPCFIVSDSTK